MFRKILVANRGETAVRVIRACHEMDIEAVAVYSEADRDSLHVRMADEAVCIGPPPARDSYLSLPNVISAAIITRCEAVHPGIAFHAENPNFPEICEAVGLAFIGPPAAVMEKMGDKARARRIMDDAKIPVVPGTGGPIERGSDVLKVARHFGYPLMIKAAAGGGGKGIRIVHTDDDLLSAVQISQTEAKAAFGSPDVYIEKYVNEARHIEVQILADSQGNVIHLWERDCSIQTPFHQKLLEESPAPSLPRQVRQEIAELAVHAARTVGYVNAGTVEFLVDKDGSYYFMEMNTRLQVEHPVTEMMTGIDLVKLQIDIAAGNPLPIRKAPMATGHAIECRIDARNTSDGFAPSPGEIGLFIAPGGPGIRVDTYAHTGAVVSSYYDPLIAKVIAHASSRDEAIAKMERALSEMIVEGPKTTREFHLRILANAFFRRGETNTQFIPRHMGPT